MISYHLEAINQRNVEWIVHMAARGSLIVAVMKHIRETTEIH